MKTILTIAKKELIDTLRDKRTILTMVAIPLLVFPILLNVITGIQTSASEKEHARTLTIGVRDNGNASGFVDSLKAREDLTLVFYDAKADTSGDFLFFRELLSKDSLDASIIISDDFDNVVGKAGSGGITIYHEATEDEPTDRLERVFDTYKAGLLAQRLNDESLAETFVEPLALKHTSVSSMQEVLGLMAGGILPYFFVIFCFLGCMYPAIDLFTGEKERGTIETILTAPVQRWQILLGKLSVVVIAGLISASLAMVGLFSSLQLLDVGEEIVAVANSILTLKFVVMLFAMLIPLTIFFAGVLIPITVYAKSFKEAQSIITPLNFVIIMPVVIGFLPGIELTATTAIIPVVNITLCTKEVIAGTLDYGLFAMVVGSLLLYASVACYFSFRQFGKEGNVLRA